MILDCSQGGLFSNPEFLRLKKRPLCRSFGLEYNPIFQHVLDCNKQTYNPIQHVMNKQNIVFGLTYNPLAKANYINSRKTYKGVVSFSSKILDWKIPPAHYNPDFEVIN